MNKFILKLFLLFLLTFKLCASNVEILNNNINNNLDSLTFQLKFLISDNEKNSDEITNLLKLYYQHFGNIEAIEIYHLKTPIHKSYKKDTEMIVLDHSSLPVDIYSFPQVLEKEILDENKTQIGKLIVYLKNEINFTKEELEYLKTKTLLKVQNDSNLTPYNFTENGIAKGYSIDYINLIANKLALKVEYTQGKWDDFMNQLENNELDMMLNVLKSKSREERFLFSDSPYLWLTPAMITRVGEKDFNSFSQLDGKTISLVKGYHSYDRVKKDYPNVNIYPVDNTLEMIKAVSEGKADVSYGLKDVLEYNINKHLITNLKITNNTDDDKFGFYFTFNKENELLKNIIYKAQNAISKKEIEELNQKWFKKISKTIKEGENFLLNKSELAFLETKKKITMCVDPNFLPYEKITHEGNYVGIIADIINQISKNTNIKFELISTKSFDESFNLVRDKSCDILPFAVQTTSRESLFNFTQTYLNFPIVIATKNSEFFISSLKELQDKRIGMIKGYALIELSKFYYPNLNIVEVKDTKEGLEKVNNSEIYGFIDTLPSITYEKERHNNLDIKISGKIPEEISAKIAIRKDEPILLDILNKSINSLKEEDKDRITNKWITIIRENQFNVELFIEVITVIVIIFISIIALLIYRSNIKLSALNKELKKLSQTDKLTSLYNRAKLDSILENEMKIIKRYKDFTSLAIIDIDHFKDINDTHGHNVGDIILKELATILKENIRETDYVGRWGGEEFLVILPRTNERNAVITAENLRKTIENHKFHNNIKVTASFGVCECKINNPTKCLIHADKALYNAKNSNRNCVRTYSEMV